LTTMVKQCRELFCPSARKSQPADRPRKGLKHPLIRRNIAGAVGISSLSWPCMYLGFLAMYRGMKSIKPYNSKIIFPAHLLKCTCWWHTREERRAGGEGGGHRGLPRRTGRREAFAARTSPPGPRGRGLSRTRLALGDSGLVPSAVGRTRAGDAVGYA